ncbi:MAG: marine proteobacterial sortase target protein [Xanthomonadales bacterium]|nr:marine proteobacterial sortase target protein [Xanthomonadales bacterium]
MKSTQAPRQGIRAALEARSQRLYPALHQSPASRPDPRRLRWQDRTLLILAMVLGAMLLLRLETASAQQTVALPDWGLTFTSEHSQWHQLALNTSVVVELDGQLARVHIAQRFRNDSLSWLEGNYRFPLPTGAAVDQLFVRVGDRIIEGEVQPREEARQTYQAARAQGKTASLVRQERANQFTTQLANIGPGETVDVLLGFLVTVDYQDGHFTFRLPTTFTPRYASEAQASTGRAAPRPAMAAPQSLSDHGFELKLELASALPLATLESLHHDVEIQETPGGYEIRLADAAAQTDRDFELRWSPALTQEPQSTLSTWREGDEVYAQLMLLPPAEASLQAQPREVIFLIDTSGSMEGASLEQARAALHEGLQQLQAGDRFNLLEFSNHTRSLFPRPEPFTGGRLLQAQRWIDRLHANGGTEMAPALQQALQGEVADGLLRQVVFITDGSVGNERELLALVAAQLGASRLFTVAIGTAPNDWFMRKAAVIGRGHATRIGRLEDVAETMNSLWSRIRLPAISDLCIDWGTGAEYYPVILPDLYAGTPLWLTAKLDREPQRVSLCGQLNGHSWSQELEPQELPGRATLATLWARQKIEALEDGLSFGQDREQTHAQITQLALKYGLLTAYTSLVAVDRTPARPDQEALGMASVPSLLPAGSTGRTAAFPNTATGWPLQLALGLLVLAISTLLLLFPFAQLRRFRRWLAQALPGRVGHS